MDGDDGMWAAVLALLEPTSLPTDAETTVDARATAYPLQLDPKGEPHPGQTKSWMLDSGARNASSMMPQGETKAASAMEIRRKRNREFMRRARQRHREDLERVKATVESLERQYAELCLHAKQGATSSSSTLAPLSPASPSSALSSSIRASHQQQQQQPQQAIQLLYDQALAAVKLLGSENVYLRAAIQDKAAWIQRVRHISELVADCVVSNGKHVALPLGSPRKLPAGMGSLPLAILDADTAHSVFGFLPLSDAEVTALMLDNSHQMHYVSSELEPNLRAGDSRNIFGWEVVQRVTQTSIMEFMFTKRFSGLSVSDIMHKTWANDMNLEKYRGIKQDVKRLEVLQIANMNAYILGRDVRAPDKNVVFRSVFLRYLIETSQTLPNPKNNSRVFGGSDSESEDKDVQPLKASGFILGTHSVNRDWSKSGDTGSNVPKLLPMESLDGSNHETLMWADLALSIEFLDVEDPTTGETFQRVRWIGRTDYKTPADALRNTVDMLSGCLRWELLMISPALNLVSLE